MDDDLIPSASIRSVAFSFYSSTDIKNLSVKRITQQSSFDGLGLPNANGLHDPQLGPTDDRDVCATCNLNFLKCPGHFGHIKLTMPVYNPFLFKTLVKILNGICFECHKLRIPHNLNNYIRQEMRLLEQGEIGNVTILDVVQQNFAPELWEELIPKYIKSHQGKKKENDSTAKNISAIQVGVRKKFLRGDFFTKSCPFCKKLSRKISTENNAKIFFSDTNRKAKTKEKDKGIDSANESYLTPLTVEEHLNLLWVHEKEIMELVLKGIGVSTTEVFVLGFIPVPPPRFRPTNPVGGQLYEHEQSVIFSKVIQASDNIKKLLTISSTEDNTLGTETLDLSAYPGNSMIDKISFAWLTLQRAVNAIVDSDLDKLSMEKNRGVKQILEKKEGILRMNMMGKRVNYAARSVISPDPFISANEIGIPYVFATKLTYPDYVTPNNFRALKEAVLNGPNKYPGATHVIDEQGAKIVLSRKNKNQREAVAKQLLKPLTSVEGKYEKVTHKVVYRHLKNGDVLLLNRQPSLHRPSIQAHRARVLANEKTLRLHYSNCKAYNADFDGDEMNAHFPQNELARSEAYNLVATNHHYTVPKDGSPLGGLIQDHMVSGVKLSVRGRFFDKPHYHQLITCALSDNHKKLKLLPPTIIKPKPLWTGKQVISTIILNTIPSNKNLINLHGSAKVSPREWSGTENPNSIEKLMDESTVVFRQAELLVGVLDKAHYGPTKYGLVHCVYEVYGGQVANDILTRFARLFTYFLQYAGFTLGISDITCTPYADSKRRKILSRGSKIDIAAAARGLDSKSKDVDELTKEYEEAHYGDGGGLKDLDLCMKQCTDNINSSVTKMLMPHGLHKKFPENNLQLMVESGAKGSKVNCMQISCLLGQIELEGRRPPLMLSGRTLPSFKKYDFSPYAGGFVGGRFLTGIKPQEYFFHCMAGREVNSFLEIFPPGEIILLPFNYQGLIDTAVKTSRSGYLQRCLIKHLEGIYINYDLTVRDHDKSVIQFYYGEDGLDITKAQFLHDSQFKFYKDNISSIVNKKELKEIQFAIDTHKTSKSWKKLSKLKKMKKENISRRISPFLEYSKSHSNDFSLKNFDSIEDYIEVKKRFYDSWFKEKDENRIHEDSYLFRKIPDPVLTRFKPDRYLGSVSEIFYHKVKDYVKNDEELEGIFDQLMYLKAMKALAQPGDAVGLLSAQSIGEPSTQMTLNTFHFAGRGEMNVTLGIPRLREILMVASANIKTPTMTIPLVDSGYAAREAESLKLRLTKVNLDQVMRDVKISEKIITSTNHQNNCRLITVRFRFLPQEIYEKTCFVKKRQIRKFMEKFLNRFADILQKAAEQLDSNKLLKTDKFKEPKEIDDLNENQLNNEEGEDEDDDERVNKLRLEDANAFDNEASASEVSEDEEAQKETPDDDDEGYATAESKAIKREEIVGYTYERSEFKWCEVVYKHPLRRRKVDVRSILEEEVKRTVIHKVDGIQRALLSQPKRNENVQTLTTEGVNIRNMYNYDKILDLNKLLTNDIHAVAKIYGIEAANKVIISEIQNVFAVYGITVNYRHLSLIADYMTFEGSYKPFNRMALETSPSPMQRMSFESTMESLRSAVIYGEKDSMISPSSRIIAGKLIGVGSGIFEAIPKIKR